MTIFAPFYNALRVVGYTDPIHPPLTHMPIGLVAAALILSLLGRLLDRPQMHRASRYCLVLAWLFIFPTVLLGFMDWQHFYDGGWVQPIIIKICLASLLFVLLSLGLVIAYRGREGSAALLAIYLLAFLTVGGLGYFGGRLVFGGRAPQAPAALETGRVLFENNCMACHPNGGNAILPDYIILGSDNLTDFKTFLAWIRNPRLDNGRPGPMPVFPPEQISEVQARELYTYLVKVFKCGATSQEHQEGH